MRIFSGKSKASRKEDEDYNTELLRKERDHSADRNSFPDRPLDPKKLPEGPDGGFVYYED